MKIGLAGDWHGKQRAAYYALSAFADQGIDTIAQVGDYGFGGDKSGTAFNNFVQRTAEEYGQTVYVTPGNHEDYDYLDTVSPREDGWCVVRPNVLFAPRGLRWNWGNRSFVSLGGAASVDRTWRLKYQRDTGKKAWWSQEAVTDLDVLNTVEPGFADVMITHEGPILPAIVHRIKGNPHGFEEEDIVYSNGVALKVHKAAHGVMPTLLFHGHHHFSHDSYKLWSSYDTGYFSTRDIIGETRVIGLNLEQEPGALAVLDTDDLSVVVF